MAKVKIWAAALSAAVCAAVVPVYLVPFFTEYRFGGFFNGWAVAHGSLVLLGAVVLVVCALFAGLYFGFRSLLGRLLRPER